MSHPSPVLLLDDNGREVRALDDALGRRALPRPVRTTIQHSRPPWTEGTR
jgi:hypothetical protein